MGLSWAGGLLLPATFARNMRKCVLFAPKLVGGKPGADGGHPSHHRHHLLKNEANAKGRGTETMRGSGCHCWSSSGAGGSWDCLLPK